MQLAVFRQPHAEADSHADDFAIDSDAESETASQAAQSETISDSIGSSLVFVLGKLADGVTRLLPPAGTDASGLAAQAGDTGWRQADGGERAALLVDGLFLLRAVANKPAEREV
jgi:hypothetical protein